MRRVVGIVMQLHQPFFACEMVFCIFNEVIQGFAKHSAAFTHGHRAMQLVGELKEPFVLCVDFGVIDAVFFFPLKDAHAFCIGLSQPVLHIPKQHHGDTTSRRYYFSEVSTFAAYSLAFERTKGSSSVSERPSRTIGLPLTMTSCTSEPLSA